MSEANLALVLHAADAWNSGGADDLLAFYPEDVVWYPFPARTFGPARSAVFASFPHGRKPWKLRASTSNGAQRSIEDMLG
jgi:hypothetical protein